MKEETLNIFGTKLDILGYQSDSIVLYFILLITYMIIIAMNHKLRVDAVQLHRESLMLDSKTRNILKIAGYNIAHTLIHIIFVLFITSNNVGFLASSIIAHCVGVIVVYRTQRKDHKHPIHKLANAIRNLDKSDERTTNDLKFIINKLSNSKKMNF
jgi:hypothetical protein